ncbi:MAG: hypothetical protein IT203_07645 [Fimbriimonadaceae bacterium]|nr:hypothetical protein [Fimbriimonadaceae bacterium]
MDVPVIDGQSPKIAVSYTVTKSVNRTRAEVDELVKTKTKQYDDLVKAGRVSQEQANRVLASLRSGQKSSEESSIVSFVFEKGTMLVTRQLNSQVNWTLISNGVSVESGWSGGDHLTLSANAQPYSAAVTQLPILPVQLPGIKEFVDFELTKDGVVGRMITISTTSGDYLPCRLSFQDGRLASAEVQGIERWKFSGYGKATDPFPQQIQLERQFDQDGNAQVVMVCTRIDDVDGNMQSLDQLLGSKSSVEIVDVRTDPPKQFTYTKGKGSVLEQSVNGLPALQKKGYASSTDRPLSFGAILIIVGLALLLGLSIWKLFLVRKNR